MERVRRALTQENTLILKRSARRVAYMEMIMSFLAFCLQATRHLPPAIKSASFSSEIWPLRAAGKCTAGVMFANSPNENVSQFNAAHIVRRSVHFFSPNFFLFFFYGSLTECLPWQCEPKKNANLFILQINRIMFPLLKK